MAILFGYFALTSIASGIACAIYRRYILTVLFGCIDVLFTFISLKGFKDILIESGKRLTVSWFGLGNYKQAFAIYAIILLFGVSLMMFGVYRRVRTKKKSTE